MPLAQNALPKAQGASKLLTNNSIPARKLKSARLKPLCAVHKDTPMIENRKHPRKHLDQNWIAYDLDRNEVIGRLVNISHEGMMLISQQPLEAGKVYQLRLNATDASEEPPVTLGVESLWVESMWSGPSQHDSEAYWAGMQIIDISNESSALIDYLLDDET
jgi:hypothetical protein